MKTDLFQSCGHCWVSQIYWYPEWRNCTASSLRIWNSSTGIPSLPLALFVMKWQPTPVFLPGESQGQGSLVGCSMGSHRVRHDWSNLAAVAAAKPTWLHIPGCLALGEWSHHHDYLGHEDLFCLITIELSHILKDLYFGLCRMDRDMWAQPQTKQIPLFFFNTIQSHWVEV